MAGSIATYANKSIPVDYAPCYLNHVGDSNHWAYENYVIARWTQEQFGEVKNGDLIGVVAYHMSGIDRVEFYLNNGDPVSVSEAIVVNGIKAYWIKIDETSNLIDSEQCYMSAIVYPNAGRPMVLGAEDDGTQKSPLEGFQYIHPEIRIPYNYQAVDWNNPQNAQLAPGHEFPLLHGNDTNPLTRTASGLGISGDSLSGFHLHIPSKEVAGVHALRFYYNASGSLLQLGPDAEMYVDAETGDDDNQGFDREFPKRTINGAIFAAAQEQFLAYDNRVVDGLVINLLGNAPHYYGQGYPSTDLSLQPVNNKRPIIIRKAPNISDDDPTPEQIISGHKFTGTTNRNFLPGIRLIEFRDVTFQDKYTTLPENVETMFPIWEIVEPDFDFSPVDGLQNNPNNIRFYTDRNSFGALFKPAPFISSLVGGGNFEGRSIITTRNCVFDNYFKRRRYDSSTNQPFGGSQLQSIDTTFRNIATKAPRFAKNCIFDGIGDDIYTNPGLMVNCRYNRIGAYFANPGNLIHSDMVQSYAQGRNGILQNFRPLKSLGQVESIDDFVGIANDAQGIFNASPYRKGNVTVGSTLAYNDSGQYFFDFAAEFVELLNWRFSGVGGQLELPGIYGLPFTQTLNGQQGLQGTGPNTDSKLRSVGGQLKMGSPYNLIIMNSDIGSGWTNTKDPVPVMPTRDGVNLAENSTLLYMENVRRMIATYDVPNNRVDIVQEYPAFPGVPAFYGFGNTKYEDKYTSWNNSTPLFFTNDHTPLGATAINGVRIKFPPPPDEQIPFLGGAVEFLEGSVFTQNTEDDSTQGDNTQNTLTGESDTNKIVIRLTGTEYDNGTDWTFANVVDQTNHAGIGAFYTVDDPEIVKSLPTISEIITTALASDGDTNLISLPLAVENNTVGGSQLGFGGSYIDLGGATVEFALSTNTNATNVFDISPHIMKFTESVKNRGGETLSLILHANRNEYKQVVGPGGDPFNNEFYKELSYIAFNSNEQPPLGQVSSNINSTFSFRKSPHHTFVKLIVADIDGITCVNAVGATATITLTQSGLDKMSFLSTTPANREILINTYSPDNATSAIQPVVGTLTCDDRGATFQSLSAARILARAKNRGSGTSPSLFLQNDQAQTGFIGQIGGATPLVSDGSTTVANLTDTNNDMNFRLVNALEDGDKNLIGYKVPPGAALRLVGSDINLKAGDFIKVTGSQFNDGVYKIKAVYDGISGDSASNTQTGSNTEFQYLEVDRRITPELQTGRTISITNVSHLPILSVKYTVPSDLTSPPGSGPGDETDGDGGDTTTETEFSNGFPSDFFPVAFWLLDPTTEIENYRKLGMNLNVEFFGDPIVNLGRKLDILKDNGMYAIVKFKDQTWAAVNGACGPNAASVVRGWNQIVDEFDLANDPDHLWEMGKVNPWTGLIRGETPCTPDDGSTRAIPYHPSEIQQQYGVIKSVDRTRPVYGNMGAALAWDRFNGRGVGPTGPGTNTCGVLHGGSADYPEYIKGLDIVSFDHYPTTFDPRSGGPNPAGQRFPEAYRNFEIIGRAMRDRLGRNWCVDQTTGKVKPYMFFVETAPINNAFWNETATPPDGTTLPLPSGAPIVNIQHAARGRPSGYDVYRQVMLGIAGGGAGVQYFGYGLTGSGVAVARTGGIFENTDIIQAVHAMSKKFHQLSSVLTSPTDFTGFTYEFSGSTYPYTGISGANNSPYKQGSVFFEDRQVVHDDLAIVVKNTTDKKYIVAAPLVGDRTANPTITMGATFTVEGLSGTWDVKKYFYDDGSLSLGVTYISMTDGQFGDTFGSWDGYIYEVPLAEPTISQTEWTPLDLSTQPLIWLDAGVTSSFALTGGDLVAEWGDWRTNGFTAYGEALQGTSLPYLGVTSSNTTDIKTLNMSSLGMNFVHTRNVNWGSRLRIPFTDDAWNNFIESDDMDLFVVLRPDRGGVLGSDSIKVFFIGNASAAANESNFIHVGPKITNTHTIGSQFSKGILSSAGARIDTGSTTYSRITNRMMLLQSRHNNNTAFQYQMYVNGNEIEQDSVIRDARNTIAMSSSPKNLSGKSIPKDILIGTGRSNGNISTNGIEEGIAEWILVPANISEDERLKMEGYLAHKWGMNFILPLDHPYRIHPPMNEVSLLSTPSTSEIPVFGISVFDDI